MEAELMSNSQDIPSLKRIIGAMIFGAPRPLSIKEMRKCLAEVANNEGGETSGFADVSEKNLLNIIQELSNDIAKLQCGFIIKEIAGGFRLQTDPACGIWVRHLLKAEPPGRLSHPALETLAIIACKQPITRAQIENIRGVSVDHIIRTLLENQLIRIVGRSELPGHPFLYGTTRLFLEHFGLKSLDEIRILAPFLAADQLSHGQQTHKQQSEKEIQNTSNLLVENSNESNTTNENPNINEKKTDTSSNSTT